MTDPNTIGPKIEEWGGYLKACQTHDQLTTKAADLARAMFDANELRRRADDLMTDAEYLELCGVGANRRRELKGEQP
jgi:hypothetical protein